VTAPTASPRAIAVRTLHAIIHGGRSLADLAPAAWMALADERDRALAQALVYGVLRRLFSLRARLAGLLARPLRRRDAEVEALLLLGLFQLEHMRIPAHAAVSATVECARELGRPWACRLVNGVLRRSLREGPAPPDPADLAAMFEHPPWLIARLREDWPDDWQSILTAGNRQAPLTLRVNTLRCARDAYQALLAAHGLAAEPTTHAQAGLRLAAAAGIPALPRFADGWVSVQDEAAQLAAELLAAQPGERVLDACAAPGGKTAHLLERTAGRFRLLALDRSAPRLARVRENLARLGLACDTAVADAAATATWWDGEPFDRILLDAPCTALGVIRRHPDIRLRRQPADIARLAASQQRLLAGLWPLLRRGGRLLYVTCSILPAENDESVAALLAAEPDASVEPIAAAWGRALRHGRQILPGEDDMDGFYFARIRKEPA
jgi:16S rRNA (cytosine967-C5)-methyltransferase